MTEKRAVHRRPEFNYSAKWPTVLYYNSSSKPLGPITLIKVIVIESDVYLNNCSKAIFGKFGRQSPIKWMVFGVSNSKVFLTLYGPDCRRTSSLKVYCNKCQWKHILSCWISCTSIDQVLKFILKNIKWKVCARVAPLNWTDIFYFAQLPI